ncbi:MAG: beta-N-acetylhexosaminidase [Deltaproteobacteria bacterium]
MMVGLEGPRLTSSSRRMLTEIAPMGVILFARNMPELGGLLELTAELRNLDPELVIAIDHEGGRVDRSPEGFTRLPPALVMGSHGDGGLVREAGRLHGRELRAAGFDLNFAPVLDVHSNEANPVIGDRAFGTTPEMVIHSALPYLQGLAEGGVAGCGKHFPGHGDTDLDSHKDLPRVGHSLARLRRVEFPPFLKAARQGVAMVMTAHLVAEALDPKLPASLSLRAIEECLRGELGFKGVVISDDLEMGAVTALMTPAEAAVEALVAGNDIVMVCQTEQASLEAWSELTRAIDGGHIDPDRVAGARSYRLGLTKKLHRLRKKAAVKGDPPDSAIGAPEHLRLAARLGA